MKRVIKILFIIIAIIIFVFFVRIFIGGPEDDWICVDGEWIEHGAPSAQKPETGCAGAEKEDLIKIYNIKPNQEIKSPLIIEGEARGSWFFEGDFPVILTNWDGLIIAETYATAQSDWMTYEFVKFKAEIEFGKPGIYNNGALILKKDNPSGLPENDDALEVPIIFIDKNIINIENNDNLGNILIAQNSSEASLMINNTIFDIEIADTNKEITNGLSGRSELGENQGMLFIFNEPGFYPFWMKDMFFSIDIIWIDDNKEVVFIKKDFQPCIEEECQTIKPNQKARYVLEIEAGTVDKIDIKIGDKIVF